MARLLTRAALVWLTLAWASQSWAQANTPAPTPEACSLAVASVVTLNAHALLEGARFCADEGRIEDANFLYAAAQIRGISDMTLLRPVDLADEDAYNLGLWLYYGSSSVGYDEFYRRPENVTALEQRLRAIELTLEDGYDPGWEYQATSKIDLYPRFTDSVREELLWERRRVGLLMQDDTYYTAFMAEQALRERIAAGTEQQPAPSGAIVTFGPGIAPGTVEYAELALLRERRLQAMSRIPEPPRPPEDRELMARLNEPTPEVAAMQIAVGFDAPRPETTDFFSGSMPVIFRSADEVRTSWLASALTEEELASLLNIDFSRQLIMVATFGAQFNASGTLYLADFAIEAPTPALGVPVTYRLTARLGVVDETCDVLLTVSFPFLVVVADASPDAIALRGYSTFPDNCGPPVGVPISDGDRDAFLPEMDWPGGALASPARPTGTDREAFVPEMGLAPEEFARLLDEGVEEAGQQVATGFNGPVEEGTLILRSEEEVRQSWLPDALGAAGVAPLLAFDFTTDALVVFALGRQTNASGKLILFELFHDVGFPVGANAGYWISARLGTIDPSCGQSLADSYPFVVGATAAVPDALVLNRGFETFPDQCGPIVAAGPLQPGQ